MQGTPLERLMDKVIPIPFCGCWAWLGAMGNGGYGHMIKNGKFRDAHVVAYEELVGPVPEGLELDHLCRVRLCVNPLHLEPVSRETNHSRSPLNNGGGAFHAAKTHCPKGHSYADEDNVHRWISVRERGGLMFPRNHRECRKCQRIKDRAIHARKNPNAKARLGSRKAI